MAYEAYHYLQRTWQVPGRNAEIEADPLSDEALEHVWQDRSPERLRVLHEIRLEEAKSAPVAGG